MSVTLRELQAEFVRHESHVETWPISLPDGTDGEHTGPRHYIVPVETIAEAQGVKFLCPACFATNGGSAGTHLVICWSRSCGVPDDVEPNPGRWTLHGTGLSDLTLDGDPPGTARSVLLIGEGCGWHGFVTSGRAE